MRFEALKVLHEAVQQRYGGFAEGIALGAKPGQGHGSGFWSVDFQCKIRCLGLESPSARVREPIGSGSVERIFRTLREAASLVAALRDSGRTGSSARRVPAAPQRALPRRTAQARLSVAGPRGPARPRACCIKVILRTVQEIGAVRAAEISPLRSPKLPRFSISALTEGVETGTAGPGLPSGGRGKAAEGCFHAPRAVAAIRFLILAGL